MKLRQHIVMLIPGMRFHGGDPLEQCLGGSETAGLSMARAFAKRGEQVTVFCNVDQHSRVDGVAYMPANEFGMFTQTNPHDVTIVQRLPTAFITRALSKLQILWCHDLALARQSKEINGCMWGIDKVFVLSDFMARQYRDVYQLPESSLWTTRNGIDPAHFEPFQGLPRDPNKLIYTSRPERGLDVMLGKIMPEILKREPNAVLHIAAYDNQVPQLEPFYDLIQGLCDGLGDRVQWLGHLTKRELYEHYATAAALVYPTPSPQQKEFREISCITAMEAMASGLPMITSKAGALPETLAKGAGVLIDGEPWTDQYAERFASETVGVMRNTALRERMGQMGRKAAESLSWAALADEWAEQFQRWICEANDDPVRLAWDFYQRSEIEGARRALADNRSTRGKALRAKIDQHYGFMGSEASVQAHYRDVIGPFYDAHLQGQVDGGVDFGPMFQQSREERFHFFEQFIGADPSIKRIVDYGCGHGWCDIYLANKTGRKVTGIDCDPNAIKWSEHFAERHAERASDLKFICGDHTTRPPAQPYDMLLCSETLEHVHDPVAVMDAMERWVKDDGWVVVTVPYGPWELQDYQRLPFRNHIRHLEHADLRDMFGWKKDVQVYTLAAKACPVSGEALGYLCVTYRKSQTLCGAIDYQRKLAYQRPRQTVSVAIMAGGDRDADTLHWCLRSVKDLAQEIVIADTGMSEEARRIADQYGARYVPSVSPQIEGFEKPRNDALKACREDWVLWIDTDEHLIDAPNVNKYLRENMFNGYSIRQHHFAVDTTFNPDMPVRLLRNRPCDGKRARFYGMIHEHPELAMNKGMGAVIILADVHIGHVGYLIESRRQGRFARNLPLLDADRKKYPKRMLQKYFIMRDLMQMAGYTLRNNGGQVTPEVRAWADEAVEVYRKHFLGKATLLNIDPLPYYTQALQIRGEGIDVSFDIRAGRDGQGDVMNGGTVARFANVEEATTEIAHRVRQKAAPFDLAEW